MIRIVGIGGEPATGKSELVQAIAASLPPGPPFVDGLIRGTIHDRWDGPGRVRILGVYDGKPYPGTDRLSMAAGPKLLGCLRAWDRRYANDEVVVFEGQRFFNQRLISAIHLNYPSSRFFLLLASESAKALRRSARRDRKQPTFLKGTATQTKNAIDAAGNAGRTMTNETVGDLERNVRLIVESVFRAAEPSSPP